MVQVPAINPRIVIPGLYPARGTPARRSQKPADSAAICERTGGRARGDYFRSKRSRFMTLSQAATKSSANFCFASSEA